MPPPKRIPDPLLHRPFTHEEARDLGVSEKVLRGQRFIRLHPRVWVHRDHVMTHDDTLLAAALAMPDRAHLSHVSRIQALGLDRGDLTPVHFTVSGDLHIALDGVFLHRTEALPPLDPNGVTPATAFLQLCATATMLDAIVAGDWLLRHGHMTVAEVVELSWRDDWRPGARQVRRVLPHLDARSRSPMESESRAVLTFAGLPTPGVNVDVLDPSGRRIAIVDLAYEELRLALEYEGRQHAEDARQFSIDITRYAGLRQQHWEYVQMTAAMVRQPRAMVLHVHEVMRRRGYRGPAPVFGDRWDALFEPIRPESSTRSRIRPVRQRPRAS